MATAVDTATMAELIEKKYKTQAEFAEKIGVSRQYIHAILNGKAEPSLSMLIIIADALGVKVDKLLRGAEVIAGYRDGTLHIFRPPGRGGSARAPEHELEPA